MFRKINAETIAPTKANERSYFKKELQLILKIS